LNVGAIFPPQADPARLTEFAKRIEGAGFDELWLVEDCFFSGGLTLAATALAATTRLRVGIGLLPAVVRNPALTAMEIATLACIHPGRLSVAFGHGVRSWMEQINALPERRLAALGEVVSAVRGLLEGQRMTTAGGYVKLADVELARPPAVVPPILLGTTGPRGLALAGQIADGFLLAEGCGPQMVKWARAQARSAVAPQPDRPRAVVYSWLALDDDAERAGMSLRPAVDNWLASGIYPDARRMAGITGELPAGPISLELANELAVAGDSDGCRAAVERFAAVGTDSLILAAVVPEFEQQYLRFAADVLQPSRGLTTSA
jgi:alkanesulfonate monooxygenase SsuD/methylene tetrahydromethanopterin reductase-like flavin-dependent oxidoreductase (luciferase family)